MCKIDDQWKFDVWSTAPKVGALGQPRGMGWGGRGRGAVQDEGDTCILWPIHVDVWQKPSLYCKVIILQLKLKKILKFLPSIESIFYKLLQIIQVTKILSFKINNILRSSMVESFWFSFFRNIHCSFGRFVICPICWISGHRWYWNHILYTI